MLRTKSSGKILALLGLAMCPGVVHAANLLTLTPSSGIALTCGPTGPGTSATVTVKPVTALTGTATLVVALPATLPAGLSVTAPALQTLSTANQAAGIVYTLNAAAGCSGVTPGSNAFTLTFKAGTANDAAATGTIAASPLAVSPSSMTVSCATDGAGHYVVSAPQTVTVTSPVTGGAALSSVTAGSLVLNPTSPSGTMNATPYTFTVAAPQTCSTTPGSSTVTMHLVSGTLPDKTITVTNQTLAWSPLTVSPTALSLSYVKGSGNKATGAVTVSSSKISTAFFSVDTTSLPSWLTVDLTSGVVTGGKVLNFTTTNVADSLTPGSYSASIRFKVSGYGDAALPVTLAVTNPAATLSVEEGTTRNLTWSWGSPLPTPTITAVSSGSPIAYTVSSIPGTLAPAVSSASGLAYSFGTPIPVTFGSAAFASAQPGNILTGAVVLTWGGGKTVTVTFNVTVTFQSATATVSSVAPTNLPTAAIGQTFTVTVYGTGFVPSLDSTQQTVAGIVNASNVIVNDANVVATIRNASTITFTITVPASGTDALLNFFAGAQSVKLGVCNPNGGVCSTPTGTATLTIAAGPTFTASGLVSASTFLTPAAIAPYDLLSIFGSNFCQSGGTGCTTGQVLYGTPNSTNFAYPTTLTPDAAGTGSAPRNLTVTFTNHATPSQSVNAPLLFATNNQINLIVPSIVTSSWAQGADITVNFGTLSSAAVKMNVAATDPGVFTVNADGTGDGAILDLNWNLISNTNPALIKPTGSDTVSVYMTGLGAPAAADISGYLSALGSSAPATIDGVVLQPSVITGGSLTIPHITTLPAMKIGQASAGTYQWAGWFPGSIAGLYQVNMQLPNNTGSIHDASGRNYASGLTTTAQLPVLVGTSPSSQANVSLWVTPSLNVVAPTVLSAPASDTAWTTTNALTATGGSSTYTFTVPAYELPAGMAFTNEAVSAVPTATGYFVATATATDTSTLPISGSVSFLLNVTGGGTLAMALPGANSATVYPATFGSPNVAVTWVTASGGTAPYTYAITTPITLPAGISIDPSTGVVSTTALTPAGVYELTVTATDSAGTPATNIISFPLIVNPMLYSSNGSNVIGKAGQTNSSLTTISAFTGNTSSNMSYVGVNLPAGFTINSATGVVAASSSVAAGTYYIGVAVTDGTTPAHGTAGSVATIYLAITLQ